MPTANRPRRFEEVADKNDREVGILKSDLTAVRLQVGNLDQKADRLEAHLEDLGQKVDRNQAQIVELLTGRTEPRIVAAPVSTTRSEAVADGHGPLIPQPKATANLTEARAIAAEVSAIQTDAADEAGIDRRAGG